MRQGEEFAQHGFVLLTNRSEPEKYFDALKDGGFFDPINNSGPVPSTNPGFVHIPFWHALGYLKAIAARAAEADDAALSEKILQVIRDVTNFRDQPEGKARDNYQTYFRFAEILGVLPLHCVTLDDVRLIRFWLSSKYDRGLVAHTLSNGLLKRLLESGAPENIAKACAVVEQCMAYEWGSEKPGRSEELTSVVDDYWLKEMLAAHACELGMKAGLDAVNIFEKGLRDIFSDKRRSYGSTLWRSAIEASSQNSDFRSVENRFVEGMRDALDGWIEASPILAPSYVARALDDDSEIIRRIAIHTVTEHFELLRKPFESVISSKLFVSGLRHELYRLLSQRFGELSADAKAAVLQAIREIPQPSTGEDRALRLKFTQREWLSSIKSYPEAAALFAELSADPELGPGTDHPDFLSYHEMRSGPGPTPFEADSLIAFAEDGSIVERLNGFVETDSWKGPTVGGLVAALEGAVASNPKAFLPLLGTFHEAKIEFQHGLIQGFKRAFELAPDKKQNLNWADAWPKLMVFFADCVANDDMWADISEQERADLVPTRAWMRTLISTFLEAATRDDKTAYPQDLLPKGWSIIKTMLDRAPPSELSLSDPMMRALNSEKGHAIGALYNHALRVCRLAKKSVGSTEDAWLLVKDAFDAEITKCKNANYDFSTLTASYIANLEFMSHQWLVDNIEHLFPASTYPDNFKVAVGGLAYATPSRRLYGLLSLHGVFMEALKAKLEDENGRRRVIEWVSLAYLWDDEGLDSPIVQAIFSGGVNDLEAMADFFWSVRGDKLTDKQITKVLAFWERGLAWAKLRERTPEQFLSRLGRLSPYLASLDDQAERLLLGVAPYVHNDHATGAMVEELSRLIDTNPRAAAEILGRTLDHHAPAYDLDDKLKALIEKLAAIGLRDEAIRCAEKVRKSLPGMLDLYKRLVATK